jgi:site-specific recombinase XerD
MKQMITSEIIEEVHQLMVSYGYSDFTISRYKECWRALQKYEKDEDISFFSPGAAMTFLEEKYGITVFKYLSKINGLRVRAIQLLCDFYCYGICKLLKPRKKEYKEIPWQECLDDFKAHQKLKHLISDKTLNNYDKYLSAFFMYLKERSLENLNELTEVVVLEYSTHYGPNLKASRHNAFCTIRVFLRYLLQKGILKQDLSSALPSVNYQRESKLPTTYSQDEVNRLLNTIDRSTPLGKRDYAIILIAVRLGLRSGDIRNLSFSNFDWKKNTIEFKTEKTGKETVLPLLKDVGEAIIDYIKNARPVCEARTIFVRHVAPIDSLTAPALSGVVRKYANKAGIDCSIRGKAGPHALRSTLATHLLEKNIPLPVISEILTHSSTRTTDVYLKLDVPHLRQCALEVPLFDWNKFDEEAF